ncbi:MAG: hypothetical protein IBX63_08030 [Coriobacteriia bacterium]|nr:hypothetical protein [Coriobacteriia bacterium]
MDKPFRESEYFVAWLLFYLATTIIGGILAWLIAFVAGAALGVSGVQPATIQVVGTALGVVVSIPVSYVCFRLIVGFAVVKKVSSRHAG